MPQLFYAHDIHENLVIVAAKIVDDILLTGIPHQYKTFVQSFNERFTLGSVTSGHEQLRIFGLKIVQNNECSSMVDAEDNISAFETCLFTRARRRIPEDTLSLVETSSFMSANSTI